MQQHERNKRLKIQQQWQHLYQKNASNNNIYNIDGHGSGGGGSRSKLHSTLFSTGCTRAHQLRILPSCFFVNNIGCTQGPKLSVVDCMSVENLYFTPICVQDLLTGTAITSLFCRYGERIMMPPIGANGAKLTTFRAMQCPKFPRFGSSCANIVIKSVFRRHGEKTRMRIWKRTICAACWQGILEMLRTLHLMAERIAACTVPLSCSCTQRLLCCKEIRVHQ